MKCRPLSRNLIWFLPRGAIDISWPNWFAALVESARACCTTVRAKRLRREDAFLNGCSLPVLSARSGLDAVLRALDLPAGSEAIVSAVNIPDMFYILQQHGLRLVPIDVDPSTLRINEHDLRGRITNKTRLILIAQLFGSREHYPCLDDLRNRHDLTVIEDAAQAYDGATPQCACWADCSIFSFGPIKTATALGGGIVCANRASFLHGIRERTSQDPIQPTSRYAKRVLWYGLLKCLEWPRAFALFNAICRAIRRDPDAIISNATHSFPRDKLLSKIRNQPCLALLRVLALCLAADRIPSISNRRATGRQFAETVKQLGFEVAGSGCESMTYWAIGVLTVDADPLIQYLRYHGFDATQRASSLSVCRPSNLDTGIQRQVECAEAVNDCTSESNRLCKQIVYLPTQILRRPAEARRLVDTLRKFREQRP